MVYAKNMSGRNSCRCVASELVKLLPVHRYCVDIFSYSGPSEYWDLAESRIPLKAVLGAPTIESIRTESAVFL